MDIRIWNTKVDTDTILQETNAHMQYDIILLNCGRWIQNILKYLLTG